MTTKNKYSLHQTGKGFCAKDLRRVFSTSKSLLLCLLVYFLNSSRWVHNHHLLKLYVCVCMYVHTCVYDIFKPRNRQHEHPFKATPQSPKQVTMSCLTLV